MRAPFRNCDIRSLWCIKYCGGNRAGDKGVEKSCIVVQLDNL